MCKSKKAKVVIRKKYQWSNASRLRCHWQNYL
jgi:hypothetical protein